jgi:hypothetical protein
MSYLPIRSFETYVDFASGDSATLILGSPSPLVSRVFMTSDRILDVFPGAEDADLLATPMDMASFSANIQIRQGAIEFSSEHYRTQLFGTFDLTGDVITGTIEHIAIYAKRQGIFEIPDDQPGDPASTDDFVVVNALYLDNILFSAEYVQISLEEYVQALILNTPGHDGYDPAAARVFLESRLNADSGSVTTGRDYVSYGVDGETVLAAPDAGIYDTNGPTMVNAYGGDDFIVLQDAPNVTTADGGDGNDQIYGSYGADILIGGDGNDTITARDGADTIEGGLGNDLILTWDERPLFISRRLEEDRHMLQVQHASGKTVTYDTESSDATVTINSADNDTLRWTIWDGTGLAIGDTILSDGLIFGTDTVSGSPYVQFSDLTWSSVDALIFSGMSSEDASRLTELYIAHFDRAPDALGLHFWGARFEEGMTLDDISGHFYASAESVLSGSAGMTNAQYISEVYQNVLARTPDAEGLAFWEQMLDDGILTRPAFVAALLEGVSNVPDGASAEVTAQYAQDRAYLDGKTDVGVYFSMIHGLNNVFQAEAVMETYHAGNAAVVTPQEQIDVFAAAANITDFEQFVVKILGVIEDPFAETTLI